MREKTRDAIAAISWILICLAIYTLAIAFLISCIAGDAKGQETPRLDALMQPPKPAAVPAVMRYEQPRPVAGNSVVLQNLNARRASRGLPPFRFRPDLTAKAQREANAMAREGRMRHIYGTQGAKGAGVGYRSGVDPQGRYFQACFAGHPRARDAGAAVAVRGGRTYYALLVD